MGNLKYGGQSWELPAKGLGCYHTPSTALCVNVSAGGHVEVLGAAYWHSGPSLWMAAVLGAPRLLTAPFEVQESEVRDWSIQEHQSRVRFQAVQQVVNFFMKQTAYTPGILNYQFPKDTRIHLNGEPVWEI